MNSNEILPKVSLHSANTSIYVFGSQKNWLNSFWNLTDIHRMLNKEKITICYLPSTSDFLGTLSDPEAFEDAGFRNGLSLWTLPTEGLLLPKGTAVLFRSADCPTLVCRDLEKGEVFTCHAGLNSVIDKKKILTGKTDESSPRIHDGVVGSLLDLSLYSIEDIEISLHCGIRHSSFIYDIHDEVHGKNNEIILDHLINKYGEASVPMGKKHGGISIKNIISAQFEAFGIHSEIVYDDIDTATDKDEDGEYSYWSHYRYYHEDEIASGRNGVLIIHK
ncbi:MAG: hypothetical protein NTZ44_00955 [Candidatus Nomurabacteria bacterium]|nr:hypothetical protein [Candidatus Nomurabacteria bacterium]